MTRRTAIGLLAASTLAATAAVPATAASNAAAGRTDKPAKEGRGTSIIIKPRRSADADRESLGLRFTPRTDLQPTGLYVAPGEVLTVALAAKLRQGDPMPVITIGAPNTQFDENGRNIDHTRPYALAPGANKVSDPYGGPVYFSWPVQSRNSKSTATATITGRTREIPTFTLGTTAERDFQKDLDRLDTPFVELISQHALLSFHRHQVLGFRREDHAALLRTIDRVIQIEDNLAGYGDDATSPVPTGPHHLVGYPGNIPGAGAQAWFQFTTYSETENDDVLTVGGVRTHGWGLYHELGHQHQIDKINPSPLAEATIEQFSLAVQRRFTEQYGQQSRPRAINKNGQSYWDDLMAARDAGITDFATVPHRFLVIEQLRLAYGEKFITQWYRVTRQQLAQLPDGVTGDDDTTDAATDLIRWQNVVYTTSMAAQVDLTDFWAGWGVRVTDQTRAKVRQLRVGPPSVNLAAFRETNINEPSVWP